MRQQFQLQSSSFQKLMTRPMKLQLQAIVLSTSGWFRWTFNRGGGKTGVGATFGQLQLQFEMHFWAGGESSCNCILGTAGCSLICNSRLVWRKAGAAAAALPRDRCCSCTWDAAARRSSSSVLKQMLQSSHDIALQHLFKNSSPGKVLWLACKQRSRHGRELNSTKSSLHVIRC